MKSSPDRKSSLNSGNTRPRSRSRSHSPRRVKVNSRRIVIANIPYNVTWTQLKQTFRDQLGFTGFLRLMKTNGRLNGMGLMEFKSTEGAQQAVEKMHRFEIGDRRIIVREETHRDQERMAHMEFDSPMNQSCDNGGSGQMMPPTPVQSMPSQPRVHPGNQMSGVTNVTPNMLEGMGIRGPITDSLYVSNLDYSVDWKKVKDTFKAAGRVIHATVKQDDDGHSRGVAVVRFEHPFEALLAFVMFNGQNLKDRPMRIKIDRDGPHVPQDMPVFPPTPKGAGAAASFMAYLNNSKINDSSKSPPQQPSIFGGANNAGFMHANHHPQSHMPGASQNPALAAAMAAILNPNAPSQEILGSLLGAASGGAGNVVGGHGNPMMGGGGGHGGFPMGNPGMNPLNQLMGMQGGGGGGMGPGGGYDNSPVGDRPRDNTAILQQFLMAAAAGGMSHDQVAQTAATLGINWKGPSGGSPVFPGGGMMSSQMGGGGDRYGDHGRRSMDRPDFDARPRYRDNSDGRNYGRQMEDNRGSSGRGSMGGRNDDRMYMRR